MVNERTPGEKGCPNYGDLVIVAPVLPELEVEMPPAVLHGAFWVVSSL